MHKPASDTAADKNGIIEQLGKLNILKKKLKQIQNKHKKRMTGTD